MMQHLIIPKRELAEILGIGERRITALITAGVLPARGPRGFDLVASVKAYVTFLKSEPSSLRTERTRVAKLKADLLEIELRQKNGELVSAEAIKRQWFSCTRTTRDALDNIAPRVAGLVAAEQNQDTCFAIIQREVRQIEEDLSHGYPAKDDAGRAQAR